MKIEKLPEDIELYNNGERCNMLHGPCICGAYHKKEEQLKKMGKIIPTKDIQETFMRSVYDWASRSKDPRSRIGAVIVRGEISISSGYNNFPRKVLDLEERYLDKETKYSFILHAEHNAILNAAKLGHSTDGAAMYTQGIPCRECCKAVINAGISKIICHKQWPNLTYSPAWVESIKLTEIMMEEAGIELEWFDKVLGVQGFLDGKVINV